jgi:hypothetical protein
MKTRIFMVKSVPQKTATPYVARTFRYLKLGTLLRLQKTTKLKNLLL